VLEQVVRVLGNTAPCDVIGRRHACGALLAAHRHGDHVFRHLLVETDTRVETEGHDIDEPVVVHGLEVDVRVKRQEPWQQTRQQKLRGDPRHVDTQGAGRRGAEVVHFLQRFAHACERRFEPFQQALPGLGQRDAACGAMEQHHAKPFLQVADGIADGRRGQGQLGAGLAEARMAGHGGEGGEVGKVVGAHDYQE